MDFIRTNITSPDANKFFGDVPSTLGYNIELESMLRYIALKHRGEGGIETVKPIRSAYSSENYSGNYYATEENYKSFELLIVSVPRGSSIPTIDADNWKALNSKPHLIAQYMSNFSETEVYINEEEKRSILFVRNTTPRWVDGLCSSLCFILPWRFEGALTGEELVLCREFAKSLYPKQKIDAEKIANIINNVCSDIDFRSIALRKELLGWADGYRDSRISNLIQLCEQHSDIIRRKQSELNEQYIELKNCQEELYLLESTPKSNGDEVFKFFDQQKQLHVTQITQRTSGKRLRFSIVETLEWYDQDEFERIYANRDSYFHDHDDAKKVFYGIFSKHKGVIRVESVFDLTNLSGLEPVRHETSGLFSDITTPHPHLYHYACLGSNEGYIGKYLQEGRWDMAILQAISATKNINFGDTAVCQRFISDIESAWTSRRCIIADNGAEMTPAEFVHYIEQEEANG